MLFFYSQVSIFLDIINIKAQRRSMACKLYSMQTFIETIYTALDIISKY